MSDLPQKQRLGKYTIARELGRGGFATVYLARDTVLHRDVALKILHPALLSDPAFVTYFENEARAIAQFDHPHIATIYDLGHQEGRIYIAVQFLSGGSLADQIRQNGPLAFADAVRVIEHVAGALDHAHAAGFIHRDVKPNNILLNGRGSAVLTDFGLVKAVESSVISRSTMGGILGTPPYMAPEVWEGKADSPQTDVYALGCVLFEALTGELLFNGNTPPAVMLTHFQPHRYPEHWPDGTPKEVQEALERALSRDPTGRYASAGALAADLRRLATKAADPLAAPYQALQTAIGGELWAEAAELAQQISARDPSYHDVRALGQRAAEALAQAKAEREAAQRAAEAQRWRAEAEQALAAKDIATAREAIESWRAAAPNDSALQVVQTELERQMKAAYEATQWAEIAVQRRVEVRQALNEKQWDAAQIAIRELLDHAPDDPSIPELQMELQRLKLQESEREQRAEATSNHPTATPNDEMAHVYQRHVINAKVGEKQSSMYQSSQGDDSMRRDIASSDSSRRTEKRGVELIIGLGVGLITIVVGLLILPLVNGRGAFNVPNSPTSTVPIASPTTARSPIATEKANKQYSSLPPMTIDPKKTYTATFTTPRGDFVVKLRPDLAPQTVNSFVFLAREGFYNGLTWHRVLPNFMAQGGDPTGAGTGGPGYTVPDEFTDKVKFDKPGILAMANTGQPNSGGSQFFVTTAPADYLDGQYTIFGEVTQGQDIVNGIPLRDPEQNPTTPGEQIVKISISEQ